ncbi:MAG: hypothetical protein IKY49_01510 [Paludibacteraceae bacterium]|nr:hypothetical protein [Paludibacteraceae bacterium]
MKKLYTLALSLCMVLGAVANPTVGTPRNAYQLSPKSANLTFELAPGLKKAPAATTGLQYDATEAIEVTYNAGDALEVTTDYISQGQVYIDVIAADYSSSTSLLLFVQALDENGNVPAGTYPITSTPAYGTAYASQGYSAQYGVTPCAYFPLVVKEDGVYVTTPMFFMVSGSVTIEYVDSKMKLTIDAVNSNGVAGKVVLDPAAEETTGLQYDEQTGSVNRAYTTEDHLAVDLEYAASGQIYVDVVAADMSDQMSLLFFANTTDPEVGVPAGVYPLSATPAYGTAYASQGYVAGQGVWPCFYSTLVEEAGTLYLDKLYYMVAGQIEVGKVDGKLTMVIDAVNSYGVPVHITYNVTPTAVEDVTTVAGNVEKHLENGQLVIIKNGVKYNATGSVVK